MSRPRGSFLSAGSIFRRGKLPAIRRIAPGSTRRRRGEPSGKALRPAPHPGQRPGLVKLHQVSPRAVAQPSDIAAPVLIAAVGPDAAFGAADVDKTLGNSCEVFASASVEPHAMVSLDVYAPCAVSQRFTLHHNGMMFTQSTDAEGEARLMIPALAAVSVFIVAFDSGATAVTSAAVPDAGLYQRAVLQFEGAGGLDLHVQENGAGFGASGHKWAGQPGDPSDLDIGAGYLIELGDNSSIKPRLAQVYTYPVNDRTADTTVSFSVEAAITPANCGQDLAAQSLQSDEFGGLDAVDLVMTMPGCDAVGDLLILGNMFADIQVAAAY